MSADRRLTFVNRTWLEWFGANAGSGPIESALPGATARALAIHAGDALEGRQTHFELTLERETGVQRDVEGVFVPDLDSRGESRGFVAMLTALQALRDARPDILVADIGMPGEDGYWLVEQVRQDPALADLPAIALTAYARAEDRARSLEAGFQIHLTKPLDADELSAAVASLVTR